jgi:preprotein translocase subunit SecE
MAAEKVKKRNRFVRFWKDLFSELKRVTWPKFGSVMKKLGVVLIVVGIFLVFITIVDFGLGQLYNLLMSNTNMDGRFEEVSAAVARLGNYLSGGI